MHFSFPGATSSGAIAPELKFLQFPWRWTLLLSIAFALSLGAAVATRLTRAAETKFRIHAVAIVLVAIAAVSLGTHFFWQPCDEEDAVSAQVALFQAGTGFEGTDEYTPLGADNSLIQQGLPKLRLLNAADSEIAISDNNENDGNPNYVPTRQRSSSDTGKDRAVAAQPKSPDHHDANSRLRHPPAHGLPRPGKSSPTELRSSIAPTATTALWPSPSKPALTRIEINYTATPDVWWGRGLSVASLLTLLALALAGQKRRKVI